MKAVKLRPFIPSGKDYELAIRFFEELGFEKRYSDSGLTVFRSGEQEFYLQNYHNQEMQDNLMVELEVEDLDSCWQLIEGIVRSEAYPIRAKEPMDYPWGKREVHLVDPSGVCWHLSQTK
ncbi:putative lactoylglutathione lyase [Paenibacillus taihuensis]|uniref:Putative lactoylglutathione lyase n=1 Tax=Paenibacillus taihuensis TaxID=1156355 RepID=A0A3D9RYY5_9BACL|nr:hypothetical protein [Paenibacillus taihuensis]REE85278.1 putative lactoylglutathione lyase [Paenibacillus taihuensis]